MKTHLGDDYIMLLINPKLITKLKQLLAKSLKKDIANITSKDLDQTMQLWVLRGMEQLKQQIEEN